MALELQLRGWPTVVMLPAARTVSPARVVVAAMVFTITYPGALAARVLSDGAI